MGGDILVSDIDKLQMSIEPAEDGSLLITFKGESNIDDVELFKKAIDARITRSSAYKKVIFDLGQIHPIHNAAGRLLDLAFLYKQSRKVPVEVRMPEGIYALLQEIT